MNKRLIAIPVIFSLAVITILSLASCSPGEMVSAVPMMSNSAGQMPMNQNDHHDEDVDNHHEDADNHHKEMDDHHKGMNDHHGSTGGHHGANGDSSSSSPVFADAREIIIVADEFSFESANITLREGEKVNITLANEGQLPHEFSIEELGFHLHAPAGETVTGGLTVKKDGTYEIGCYIAGHYEQGMFGELTVAD